MIIDIQIGRKKYEFILSAEVAKSNARMIARLMDKKEEVTNEEMIDSYAKLVHGGLVSARYRYHPLHRLFLSITKPLPKPEKILHLVGFEEMQDLISGGAKAEKGKK